VTSLISLITCNGAMAVGINNQLEDVNYWDSYDWSQLFRSDMFSKHKYSKLKTNSSSTGSLADLYEREVIFNGDRSSLKISTFKDHDTYFRLVNDSVSLPRARELQDYVKSIYGKEPVFYNGNVMVAGKLSVISETYRWTTKNTAITFAVMDFGNTATTILMFENIRYAHKVSTNFLLTCSVKSMEVPYPSTIVFNLNEESAMAREPDLTLTDYYFKTSDSQYVLSKYVKDNVKLYIDRYTGKLTGTITDVAHNSFALTGTCVKDSKVQRVF
jgi:hypothetical protein